MVAAFLHRLRRFFCVAFFVFFTVLAVPKQSASRPPAKPAPLRAVSWDALPLPLRQSIPTDFVGSGGAHDGVYWFVWYRRVGKLGENPSALPPTDGGYMATWKADTQGRKMTLRRLRTDALPFRTVPFLTINADRRAETAWLRPRERCGPIWTVTSAEGKLNPTSFYVFPNGYGGPVWIFTGGGGPDSFHLQHYNLGLADERGFRVLQGEYREPDAGGFVDNVFSWRRYWTGKGWDRKGPDTIKRIEYGSN